MKTALLLVAIAALNAGPALGATETTEATTTAEDTDGALETLYVWGRRETALGPTTSSSEGEVAFGAFVDRPLLRPAEVLEVVPGLAATQHSGSGKANQYFMRGFNLDHGTDFSVTFDGAPLNLRTSAHGQGYLDLNFLSPELVETIAYRKGPYFADAGDFSAAGSVSLATFGTLDEAFASATLGQYGYVRLLAASPVGDGYVAADLTANDGAWVSPERLRRGSVLVRQQAGDWALSALAFSSRWNATDQIPERGVTAGQVDRFGTVDRSDGGRTERFLLSARRDVDDGLKASAYAQYYALKLWSNFTYFLEDPVNGDQFEQAETRWIAGGSISKAWDGQGPISSQLGAEVRLDHLPSIGLYRTRDRARLSTVRSDRVDQWSGAAWAEVAWRQGPLSAALGLRLDGMGVDVRAKDRSGGGRASDGILSPKLSASWQVNDSLKLYANAGRGFHSNDARGATGGPARDGAATPDAVDLLVPATGGEFGLRWERAKLATSLTVWSLRLDSELVYAGDSGESEATDASRRTGVEALASWSPSPRLRVEASGALTRSRYANAAGADRIPNALEYVVTGGLTARLTETLSGSITVRRLGPGSLVEDDSARAPASTVANGLLRYRRGPLEVTAEILNLLGSKAADINYYYTSRLPNEPPAGVTDRHFHPLEPRMLRVGVRRNF